MKNILRFFIGAFIVLIFSYSSIHAQVSVNSDGNPPHPSAILEIKSDTKGFLPPHVALTATNTPDPVTVPAVGLLAYNTATAGTSPDKVIPGYYFWNGTQWVSVVPPQGTNVGVMLYWNGSQWDAKEYFDPLYPDGTESMQGLNIELTTNGQTYTIPAGMNFHGRIMVYTELYGYPLFLIDDDTVGYYDWPMTVYVSLNEGKIIKAVIGNTDASVMINGYLIPHKVTPVKINLNNPYVVPDGKKLYL
jgi:hypothetical protein